VLTPSGGYRGRQSVKFQGRHQSCSARFQFRETTGNEGVTPTHVPSLRGMTERCARHTLPAVAEPVCVRHSSQSAVDSSQQEAASGVRVVRVVRGCPYEKSERSSSTDFPRFREQECALVGRLPRFARKDRTCGPEIYSGFFGFILLTVWQGCGRLAP